MWMYHFVFFCRPDLNLLSPCLPVLGLQTWTMCPAEIFKTWAFSSFIIVQSRVVNTSVCTHTVSPRDLRCSGFTAVLQVPSPGSVLTSAYWQHDWVLASSLLTASPANVKLCRLAVKLSIIQCLSMFLSILKIAFVWEFLVSGGH